MKKVYALILMCLSLQLNAKMLTKTDHFPTPEEILGTPKKDNFPTPQEVLGDQASVATPVVSINTPMYIEPKKSIFAFIDWNKVWGIMGWLTGIGVLILAFFKRKYIANKIGIKWILSGGVVITLLFLATNPSQSDFEKYVKYQIGDEMVRDKKHELYTTRTSYFLVYSVYEYKYFSGSHLTKQGTYYGFLKTFK